MDAATYHSAPLSVTFTPAPHLHAVAFTTDQYDKLLEEFPKITSPNFTQTQAKHGVEHFKTTQGPPVHAQARRLPPDKLLCCQVQVQQNESHGDYMSILKSMGITIAHGPQDICWLEAMWRLPMSQ